MNLFKENNKKKAIVFSLILTVALVLGVFVVNNNLAVNSLTASLLGLGLDLTKPFFSQPNLVTDEQSKIIWDYDGALSIDGYEIETDYNNFEALNFTEE